MTLTLSSGLILLLRKTLLDSVQKGATHRAVLCYEKAVHIYHEFWDAGWGCGFVFLPSEIRVSSRIYSYRNFMMLCAALMDQPTQAAYSLLISAQTPPSVNGLKVLIEEAWKHGKTIDYPHCNTLHTFTSGFDPEGAEGFKGKLVGHKKWIGTTGTIVPKSFHRLADPRVQELYVAFTYKGIPYVIF
jgi:hypothetical protein